MEDENEEKPLLFIIYHSSFVVLYFAFFILHF
jgi:hypothetical protein